MVGLGDQILKLTLLEVTECSSSLSILVHVQGSTSLDYA